MTNETLFARMLELEHEVRGDKAVEAFGVDVSTRARAHDRRKRHEQELFGLLDGLTREEAEQYGHYRRAERHG